MSNHRITIYDLTMHDPQYIDLPEVEYPCCPVCGAVLYEELFFDIDEHIVGCSECVSSKDAAEYWEEDYEAARQAYDDRIYDAWKNRQCGL